LLHPKPALLANTVHYPLTGGDAAAEPNGTKGFPAIGVVHDGCFHERLLMIAINL